MTVPITADVARHMLATFKRTAWRWEARPAYYEAEEQEHLALYLAGRPVEPPDMDWYRPWLDGMTRMRADGRTLSRVIVLDEPPTGYQQWRRWASRWAIEAGEQITWIRRSRATELALPASHDFWLLDSERVIALWFAPTGEISRRELITDPESVNAYLTWQHLAVSAAEEMTAA